MTDGLSSDIFLQEARDLLAEVEGIVLDLETAPDNREALNRLFRAMHTIKGSGAMFGFDAVAAFAHHVETLLDHVRRGAVPVTKRLIDLMLSAADHIEQLLSGSDAGAASGGGLIAAFHDLTPTADADYPAEAADRPNAEAAPGRPGEPKPYDIRFRPAPDIFRSGMDPALLIDALRGLGPCQVEGLTDAVPSLASMEPERCYLSWEIRLTAATGLDAIHDVFIFVSDESDLDIRPLDAAPDAGHSGTAGKGRAVETAKAPVQPRPAAGGDADGAGSPSGIRVPSQKLDHLINLVGELLVTQERISDVAGHFAHIEEIKLFNLLSKNRRERNGSGRREDAADAIRRRDGLLDALDDRLDPMTTLEDLYDGMAVPLENLERLTRDLRDAALAMRMVEIGTVFGKLRRLVRDLGETLGKEVELITEGGSAELDKTLIDRLNDPLVHLIRNSVDHGIEEPRAREAAGKPRKGTLRLSAFHREGRVVIAVADDGQGIDTETLRAKALQAGFLSKGEDLKESDLLKLIFQPGLTTADRLTKVSGRGVGMDVVKREIDAMGGTIAIDSRRGRYCRFTISLPLTLAIVNGLLVEAGGDQFVLPMSQVAECVEFTSDMRRAAQEKDIFLLRGDIVPFIRLNDLFLSEPSPTAREQIVIVELEETRVGLLVDAILGDVQTVVKSMDQRCHRAECFAGATVLGDGRLALVLDISGLVACAARAGAD